MISLIKDLPDHVVGFFADGQITKDDFAQTVTPAVKTAFEKHEKVSILYELGGNITGVDFGAGFEDMIMGVAHFMRWKRIAIITNFDWMRKSAELFGTLMPAEVHAYTTAERDQARAWVTAA